MQNGVSIVLWCGKKKPSIKEEIEQAKGRLSKEQYKAAESNYKRMAEHVDKLENTSKIR